MSKSEKSFSVKRNLKNYVLISLFTAITIIASFISIPAPIPFTLQTLGIFCTLTVLGGKRGLACVILYIFLGIIGLPVFNGFSGGIGHLLGPTGGYIIGFIPLALFYLIADNKPAPSDKRKAIGLAGGLLLCYLTGSLWYTAVYMKSLTFSGFLSSLSVCALPFIIPDALKILCAVAISKKLTRAVKL